MNKAKAARITTGATAAAAVCGLVVLSITPANAAAAAAPSVTTRAASSVTGTSAVLNGTASPNRLSATAWFQWGTSTSYGGQTSPAGIGSGHTSVAVKATLSALTAGTVYHYRLAAANSKGTTYGRDVTFTTSAAMPPPASKVIYLTFDDGPTPGYTNEVLADLSAAGARATFFEIGKSTYTASGMQGQQALVQSVLAGGNQIGTHSWDHPNFATLTLAQTQAEIVDARTLQVSYTGHDSKLFRYPYFISTSYGDQVLSQQGMTAMGADVDPSDWDWQHVSDTAVISNVLAAAHDGAVVDLHDGQDVLGRDGGHPGYLPGLLTQLKAAGYTFGTL
jgi:peptidoglycan-N-acetylglucosamine deacetylase